MIFTTQSLYTNGDAHSEGTRTEENEIQYLLVVIVMWKDMLELISNGDWLVLMRSNQQGGRVSSVMSLENVLTFTDFL